MRQVDTSVNASTATDKSASINFIGDEISVLMVAQRTTKRGVLHQLSMYLTADELRDLAFKALEAEKVLRSR